MIISPAKEAQRDPAMRLSLKRSADRTPAPPPSTSGEDIGLDSEVCVQRSEDGRAGKNDVSSDVPAKPDQQTPVEPEAQMGSRNLTEKNIETSSSPINDESSEKSARPEENLADPISVQNVEAPSTELLNDADHPDEPMSSSSEQFRLIPDQMAKSEKQPPTEMVEFPIVPSPAEESAKTEKIVIEVPVEEPRRISLLDQLYRWRGGLSILGGFLIHLTLGSYFYSFGNLNTYMTSYLRARVDSAMTYSKTIWVNAGVMLGQGLFMVMGGWMDCRLGDRPTAIIGCAIFSAALLLTSQSIELGFLMVTLTFGFLASSGLGMAYVVPLVNGMKWFPLKKGTVNGIIVAGYGLGALPMNYFQTAYLNPDNLPTDSDGYFTESSILDKVPHIFLLTGIIYLSIQVVAVLLMGEPPAQQQPCPTLEEGSETEPMVATSGGPCRRRALTPLEMLRTKEFYILWLTFALTAQAVQYTNTMYKAFGQLFIHNDKFLSTVGSLAALVNCIGRIVWGILLDRSSYRICMMFLTGLLSFFMFTFSLTPRWGEAVYTFWVLASYFSFSGLFVLFPTAIAKFFGPSHCGTNFGILFTAPAMSSFIGASLVFLVQDHYGYVYSFILIGSFSLIAFILTYFFPQTPEVSNKSN